MLGRGPLKLLKTMVYKTDHKFQLLGYKMHLITGVSVLVEADVLVSSSLS